MNAPPVSGPKTYAWPRRTWRRFALWLRGKMPKGLFARSLLIVILPMVLLQSLVAYVFMERHWQQVTHRLSAALAQDVGALADIFEAFPSDRRGDILSRVAAERLSIDARFMPRTALPPALPKPFVSLLDRALSEELRKRVGRPFFLDTIGNSNLIEIRVQLADAQMRVIAHRSQAYASNSSIFLMWMVGTALVLIAVAVLFLRNQIRPIRRLANAAEAFGKGRDIAYRPSGAREVRRAGLAFVEMKRRVERAREQRMAMLNGVSHDLSTVLTRFRLSLALIGEGPEHDALRRDTVEMQRMLESYLAFARGDGEEAEAAVDIRAILNELAAGAERAGCAASVEYEGDATATVRPDAYRRCLANLVANAQRYGARIDISALRAPGMLTIHIDDDGPGIPAQSRDDAFKPFHRLDEGRNQDQAGSGLGLAIARDIARAHGGDVLLADSPLGGLRATVKTPV